MATARLSLFALLLLALVSVGFAADQLECTNALNAFKDKLAATSFYVPMEGMAMPSQMDDMDRRRDGADHEDGAPPTNCLNVTTSEEGIKTLKVNCDSHRCISYLLDLVSEFQVTFSEGECTPPQGFSVEAETQWLVDSITGLRSCNQCVVLYTQFTKLEDQMKATHCLPSTTTYLCDSECNVHLAKYVSLWNTMLEGKCHMNDPGGCGEPGGVTEGEIYDILKTLTVDIDRARTVVSLCKDQCATPVDHWFSAWVPLVKDGCISSADLDISQAKFPLECFPLDSQCGVDCKKQIENVIKEFFHTPQVCKVGLVEKHFDNLVNSINSRDCNSEVTGWNITEDMTVAKGFFTLSLVCVGVALLYVITGTAYNRCVKGKKGWDSLPPLFRRSSKGKYRRVKSPREEEDADAEEILFQDGDDDRL